MKSLLEFTSVSFLQDQLSFPNYIHHANQAAAKSLNEDELI